MTSQAVYGYKSVAVIAFMIFGVLNLMFAWNSLETTWLCSQDNKDELIQDKFQKRVDTEIGTGFTQEESEPINVDDHCNDTNTAMGIFSLALGFYCAIRSNMIYNKRVKEWKAKKENWDK